MLNTVINSFKLKNAYSTNSFIYNLRKLPIIGKKIPSNLYGNRVIMTIINIIFGLFKIISLFVGKFIYVGLMIYLPATSFKNPNAFLNIFVFLTLIGAFGNTFIFNPNKDKYYSIILMKTDAKKYALYNFYYFLITLFISFYPAVLVYGIISNINIYILLLLPLLVICMKPIGNFFYLKYYEKKKKVITENNFLIMGIAGLIGISLAYIFPSLGYCINYLVFIIILTISIAFALYSLTYIRKCNDYNKVYKEMLTLNNIIFDTKATNVANKKKQYEASIDAKVMINSNKKGYGYFNELFIKRHRNILTRSAIITSLIALGVILITFIGTLIDKQVYIDINKMTLTSLPYFVFIMYVINRGSVITQAMFINCDSSMLNYRFYRQPKVILELFKKRLKTLIKINMIPSLVIAIGLPFLLFVTGGTSNDLNYILLFISIISLSVFFSVHHLVIYYLLQPYDINMKAKSSTYSIVNGITYFICYLCIDLSYPTLIFATFVTLFSVIYILVALYLVYKYAYKTFKLK